MTAEELSDKLEGMADEIAQAGKAGSLRCLTVSAILYSLSAAARDNAEEGFYEQCRPFMEVQCDKAVAWAQNSLAAQPQG